jgi:putative ABC transport system permease protein
MNRMLRHWKQVPRTFTRNPGFSIVVVLTLMIGIGVTTAVFSIFDSVLLRPLPYPNPEELVRVYDTQPACPNCPASFPKYYDWRERNHVFAAIGGGVVFGTVTLTGSGDPTKLTYAQTTASLMDVFQVRPLLGRWYTSEEDLPHGPQVVVLDYTLWHQQFNEDRQIIGRKLTLDGYPFEVIGVMPDSFSFQRAQMFLPLQLKPNPATRNNHFLSVFARLKKGVTRERAATEMRALGDTLAREFGNNHGIDVQSLRESMLGYVRTPLNMLMGAVSLLLLIACANVANLLLASGIARQHELAIRMALGAGPRELVRQLIMEGIFLSLAGGVLGVLLAQWIVSGFVVLAGDQLPRAAMIQIDGRVLIFTAALSIGVGMLCSLWPAMILCRKNLVHAIRESNARSGSHSSRKIGNGLVIAEIAIAFGLLICSGLLIKNLILLQNRDTGMRVDHVIAFDVEPTGSRYQNNIAQTNFLQEYYSRLTRINGVAGVGMTSHLPMYLFGNNSEFQIDGGTPWAAKDAPLVETRWIYGDYFSTIGVPLLKGRLLDRRDGKGTKTILINKAMAEKFCPGKDPIGRKLWLTVDPSRQYEIVGIIGNIRSFGLVHAAPYELYHTVEQEPFGAMTVVIRTTVDDTRGIISAARQILKSIDPSLPLSNDQTLKEVVSASVGEPRLLSALTGLFGALAGLLSMTGIYSVMAYNVRRQRREFGVRIALGAMNSDVARLVLRRGLWLVLSGIIIGAIGAWFLTGLLKALLYDVKPADPMVFAGTVITVFIIGLLASIVPARSAARVDPMISIRNE